MEVKDCNGKALAAGDSVIVTQNLKGKGFDTVKRGTVVKNIRLYDEDNIEGKVDGTMMVLKTIYVKKK